MKRNICDFQYPSSIGRWHFRWPWHVLGGFRGWLFKTWSVSSKDNLSVTNGIIILGMTRVDTHWLCTPEVAIKHFRDGQDRLVKWLLDNREEEIWGD